MAVDISTPSRPRLASRLPLLLITATLLGTSVNADSGELSKQHDALYGNTQPVTRYIHSMSDVLDDHSGIDAIGLERTPCFGECPIYTVIIHKDGTFRYVGEAYVSHIGTFTGTVDTSELRDLFKYVNEMKYFQLATGYAYLVPDSSGTFTMVRKGSKTKVVSNYANSGPAKLWALEQLIDKLVMGAKWDKPVR